MVRPMSYHLVCVLCLLCAHCAPTVLDNIWSDTDPASSQAGSTSGGCPEHVMNNACSQLNNVCNTGTCKSQGCSYTCTCPTEYTGKFCQTRVTSTSVSTGNGDSNGQTATNGNGHTNGNGNGAPKVIDSFWDMEFLEGVLNGESHTTIPPSTKSASTSTSSTTTTQAAPTPSLSTVSETPTSTSSPTFITATNTLSSIEASTSSLSSEFSIITTVLPSTGNSVSPDATSLDTTIIVDPKSTPTQPTGTITDTTQTPTVVESATTATADTSTTSLITLGETTTEGAVVTPTSIVETTTSSVQKNADLTASGSVQNGGSNVNDATNIVTPAPPHIPVDPAAVSAEVTDPTSSEEVTPSSADVKTNDQTVLSAETSKAESLNASPTSTSSNVSASADTLHSYTPDSTNTESAAPPYSTEPAKTGTTKHSNSATLNHIPSSTFPQKILSTFASRLISLSVLPSGNSYNSFRRSNAHASSSQSRTISHAQSTGQTADTSDPQLSTSGNQQDLNSPVESQSGTDNGGAENAGPGVSGGDGNGLGGAADDNGQTTGGDNGELPAPSLPDLSLDTANNDDIPLAANPSGDSNSDSGSVRNARTPANDQQAEGEQGVDQNTGAVSGAAAFVEGMPDWMGADRHGFSQTEHITRDIQDISPLKHAADPDFPTDEENIQSSPVTKNISGNSRTSNKPDASGGRDTEHSAAHRGDSQIISRKKRHLKLKSSVLTEKDNFHNKEG